MIDNAITTSVKRPPPRHQEPFASRLRRCLLFASFLAGVGLLLVLWTWQTQALTIWGVVDGMPIPVAAGQMGQLGLGGGQGGGGSGSMSNLPFATGRQTSAASIQGGKVAEIAVSVGQKVQPGDLLARIDDTALKAQLVQIESAEAAAEALHRAQLAEIDGQMASLARENTAKAQESRLRTIVALGEARLGRETLEQELRAATDELRLIVPEVERRTDLVNRQQMRPDELFTLRQRQIELSAIQDLAPRRLAVLGDGIRRLEEVASGLDVAPQLASRDTPARSEDFERSLGRLMAEVITRTYETERIQRHMVRDALLNQIKATTITSPVQGVIVSIASPAGSVVQSGTPVLQLVQTPANRVIAWVGERQARFVTAGAEVSIRPSGMGRRALTGRVTATGGAVDMVPFMVRLHFTSADRGLPVLVVIDDGELTPGERVEIRFGGAPWWSTLSW